MDSDSNHRVFVSYSRADQAIVTPIVHVIRAVGVSSFQDVDSIPYGKRWRPVVEDSVDNASLVLVFWCAHSRQSREVRAEWSRALGTKKELVPVLLDSTQLDAGLADFQAVDFRTLVPQHTAPAALALDDSDVLENLPEDQKRLLDSILNQNRGHAETIDADIAAAAAARLLSFIRTKAV